MLRIDAKQLIENDGLYYHQGILFTGIAFFLNTPLIEKVNEYSQGKLIGPYTSKWLDNDKSILKVEIDELDGDGELQQALFEGSPFTGIGYDIDGGVCHQESDYENGWICQEIDFYKNGEVGYINLKNQTLSEEVRYNNKGDIEEYQLNKFNNFNIELFYTEQALRTVRLNGDFFGGVHKDEYLLGIDVPDTLEKVKKLKVDSTLNLYGLGISDMFLEAVIHNDGLKYTKDIYISNTSLSLESIINIIRQTNLVRLWIDHKSDDVLQKLPSILKELKMRNPECDIELNNEKII